MWNCPLCASENSTMVCSCGYDKSRDHALYPTFVPLPAGTPSAVGISAEPEPRMAVVKCPDCGLEAVIYEDQFHPTCKKCENTPLNPTDHVRIYSSAFQSLLSGKHDINPYKLYALVTKAKALFPYADPETARDLANAICTLCEHPETIGLQFPDLVKPLLALESKSIRRMLDRGELGKNIFDEWESENRDRLNKRKEFLCNAGFLYDRNSWHFTPFQEADYQHHKQATFFQDAVSAYARGKYQAAMGFWNAAKAEGNPYAAAHLGMMYHYGEGCTQDRTRAWEYFLQGAQGGCPLAAAWVAEYYRLGHGPETDKSFGEALYRAVDPELQKMCQYGDAEAQYFRGFNLIRGIAIAQNYQEGLPLIEWAYTQGHPRAAVTFASCYYYGDGLDVDYDRAFRILNEQSQLNNKIGQYLLGESCYLGLGTREDPDRAFPHFKRAAELGHETAKYYLGECYRLGKGTEVNYAEAAKWYQDAADNHQYGSAAYQLGCLYREGQGVTRDIKMAFHYWKIAAELGDGYAKFALGYCYNAGWGTEVNHAEAARWYHDAADNHQDASAATNLAALYRQGQGVAQDDKMAFHYWEIAAKLGNITAMKCLADSYRWGVGTDIDYAEAVRWYRDAADNRHEVNVEALSCLASMYHDGQGVAQDDRMAFQYWEEAAQLDDDCAMYMLGNCYYNGWGTEVNYAKAADWYRSAAQMGHTAAKLDLSKLQIQLQENLDEAWLLLQELEESAEVLYWRSVCLEKGWGCRKDKRLAKQYYNSAIEKGYVDTAKKKKRFGFF